MSSPALSVTPAMQQYHRMKAEHPDAILFFRMGDFYEMFFEDAVAAAEALEIDAHLALEGQGRQRRSRCAACPYHAARRLHRAARRQGFRVAHLRADGGPAHGEGRRQREVVRVVTPGHAARDALDARARQLRGGDRPGTRTASGVAWLEPTTGEFVAARVRRCAFERLRDELGARSPRELLVPRRSSPSGCLPEQRRRSIPRAPVEERDASSRRGARRELLAALRRRDARGLRLRGAPRAIAAAGALLRYLRGDAEGGRSPTSRLQTSQARRTRWCSTTSRAATSSSSRACGRRARRARCSHVLDRTKHRDGRPRCFAQWILRPLVELERIRTGSTPSRSWPAGRSPAAACATLSTRVQDLERLLGRVALGTAGPRDLVALATSLRAAARRRASARVELPGAARAAALERARAAARRRRRDRAHAGRRTPPGLCAKAASSATASTRSSTSCARSAAAASETIAAIEERERERTGIGSLKVALQPGLRLLHRDQPSANLAAGAGRLRRASRRSPAASASSRRS